jgi:hypothetical protein
MDENVETIEILFSAWVRERELDAKARREGMERIEKRIGNVATGPDREAFIGRLLIGPPELPAGHEVYVTRRGKLAYYRDNGKGGAWLDLYENRERLADALGQPGRDMAEAIFKAVDRDVEELDW